MITGFTLNKKYGKKCTCKNPVTHHFDNDKTCVRCGGEL